MSQTLKFHVERLPDRESWWGCSATLTVKQVTNRYIVSRRCGTKPELRIRLDDSSWGSTYCPLHARLRIEELQAELLAEPVEEEKAAS